MNGAFADAYGESLSGRLVKARSGASDYWAFVPNALPPAIVFTEELSRVLSQANIEVGRLSGIGSLLANPTLLIRPYIAREAVLSSRIEGTQSSLADLFFYEAAERSPNGRTDTNRDGRYSDVREVANYTKALRFGIERLNKLPISLRFVRELHAILMEGVRGENKTPGEFRNLQNWIGSRGNALHEAQYVPPPPREMIPALDAWEKYLHTDSRLPVLIDCALMHYQFEAIHPFLDGNGRIGRLLIPLILVDWRVLAQPLLYLSVYFERYRDDYYRSLADVGRCGDWDGWLRFFLRGVYLQASDAIRRTERLLNLQADYRERVANVSRSANAVRLIELAFQSPIITVPMVVREFGITQPGAKGLCDRLVDVGILEPLDGPRRPRLFRATEILRVLDENLP
jgi:Fic family protein